MMGAVRKTSQRTLTVYALFFSLCATGRCFQVLFLHFLAVYFSEVVFACTTRRVARVENQVDAFSRAGKFGKRSQVLPYLLTLALTVLTNNKMRKKSLFVYQGSLINTGTMFQYRFLTRNKIVKLHVRF